LDVGCAKAGFRSESAARKRLLIVSPHFPPADAADMHRVRMNVRHYREHGWAPVVLTVDAGATGRLIDRSLLETVPPDLEVRRCGALPLRLARPFGVSDIALRSYVQLRSAGDALIRSHRPDLILFSTTAFLTMALGARWRRRHGVPFVLDLQDPWHAAPAGSARFQRRGVKHELMRRIHNAAEARTAPSASGLLSVSDAYIEALRHRFPSLAGVPAETAPFGHADSDIEAARRVGRAWRWSRPGAPFLTCVCAGRIAPPMLASLEAFVSLLAHAQAQGAAPLADMRAGFLGTGYKPAGNPAVSAAAASRFAVADRIAERPDRAPLLDAIKTLLEADILLILGSEDAAYQPSKLYQYLSLRKPLVCVAPATSRLAETVRELKSVVFIAAETTDMTGAVQHAAAKLTRLLADGGGAYSDREPMLERFSARALAARECDLFERALAHSRQTP
jgi:hypothetical protein